MEKTSINKKEVIAERIAQLQQQYVQREGNIIYPGLYYHNMRVLSGCVPCKCNK